MLTFAVCALLIVGAALFLAFVLRIAWYGALVLWRGVLRIVEAVIRRIAGRDIS